MKKQKLKFAVVATDVVALAFVAGELSVLLIEPTSPDYKGKLALIGGLVHPEETAEESVIRHLKDKGGIKPDHIEQLHTFSALNRDTRGRVISVGYLALVSPRKVARKSQNALWLPLKKAKNLAYDHDDIIKEARRRLRERISSSDIIRFLLPSEFTLTHLQRTYEIILGKKLDKRNFRKKILATHWIEETGGVESGAHRPARLYRFTKKRHHQLTPFS